MAGPGVAGCFGKLRGNGDFVTRRLPACFVEPWDAMLQAGLLASRASKRRAREADNENAQREALWRDLEIGLDLLAGTHVDDLAGAHRPGWDMNFRAIPEKPRLAARATQGRHEQRERTAPRLGIQILSQRHEYQHHRA